MAVGAPRPATPRTAEQERAHFALQRVRQARDQVGDKRKEFRSLAQSAPSDIQVNGLAHVLAFWKAKNERHHQALFQAVSDWVKKDLGLPGGEDLLTWITNPSTSSVQYRHATASALAVLVWIKRFAEVEIPDEG